MTRRAALVLSLASVVVGAVLPWVRSPADRPAVGYRDEAPVLLGSRLNHVAVIGDSYTSGSVEGGQGAAGWTELTWQMLARSGVRIVADVAAEGGAGYGVPGNRGSVFRDLAARAVRPDDALVVFFGSRNDQDADAAQLPTMIRDTFDLARQVAPEAKLLVIGPPWPTADVPDTVLRVRDILSFEAYAVGAEFVDPIADGWFVGAPDLIGGDGVHPTDAGHAYLADKIEPLIQTQLG